ncbi:MULTISPECIES: DUF6542 domain-containing protein [Corynebacterium]|uniref:DUF6542 domain-containing protein n=1 Tax=Corynebacterium TaxID=1716 RepID=UPI001959E1E9|nr:MULTISPECIES: DUF6542 domain-containing protein [Corynebacterium]MDN8625212.1 hypothetical protein [Corynebacterium kroppenstedtii]QRQ65007.1 hypothetical protein I6J23_00365 [Corynebacterium kroppenstedtii]
MSEYRTPAASPRTSSGRSNSNDNRFWGLLWWAPLAIIAASMATGMLISSAGEGALGRWYFIFFVASSLITTLLVTVQGLLITVCAQPILFTVLTPICSLLAGKLSGHSEGIAVFSKTSLLANFFPVVQHFFVLLWTVVISSIIAVLRFWLYRRQTARVTARRQSASSRASRNGQQKQRSSASRAHRPHEYRSDSTSTSTDSAHNDPRRSPSAPRRHQPRSYEANRSSRVSSRYEERYEDSAASRRQHDGTSRNTHQGDRERYRDHSSTYSTPQSPTYPSKKFTPRTYRPDDGTSSLPPRTTRPRHSRRD